MKSLSLARLPLVLGAIIGTALLLAIAVLYLRSSARVSAEQVARQQLMAQQLAQQVAAKLEFQQSTLAQFAQMDAVLAAAMAENWTGQEQLMGELQQYLPHVWKLRLVPPRFQRTEPNLRPPIGYADLDLINYSAAQGVAPAAVAGEGGTPQARIVLVEPVIAVGAGEVIGHLLLAVRFSLVGELVDRLEIGSGYLQLQQARKTGDPQVLVAIGNNGLAGTEAHVAPVAGSQWQVAYWPVPAGGSLGVVFAAVVLVLLLIVGGALFVLSRSLTRSISVDLATLVTMVRDARAGELKPVYPAQASDVVGTIHTIREELAGMSAGAAKTRSRSKSSPQPVGDTPDIDLDLDLD